LLLSPITVTFIRGTTPPGRRFCDSWRCDANRPLFCSLFSIPFYYTPTTPAHYFMRRCSNLILLIPPNQKGYLYAILRPLFPVSLARVDLSRLLIRVESCYLRFMEAGLGWSPHLAFSLLLSDDSYLFLEA
jgi:hypothetical protein